MQLTYKNVRYTVDAVPQTNGAYRWRFDAMVTTQMGSSDLPTANQAIELGIQRAQEFIDTQVKA